MNSLIYMTSLKSWQEVVDKKMHQVELTLQILDLQLTVPVLTKL